MFEVGLVFLIVVFGQKFGESLLKEKVTFLLAVLSYVVLGVQYTFYHKEV